ncbi:hypothetical protein FRC08_016819 [Ceratobasidium sp. 394]|nr:hypothetical protein FRC08_016819 [Ceratobasidium sp. 394]
MTSERSPLLPVTHPVAPEPQPVTPEPQPATAEPPPVTAESQSGRSEPPPGTAEPPEISELGATPERGPYGWNNPGPMFKHAKRNIACLLLMYGILCLLDRFVIHPDWY